MSLAVLARSIHSRLTWTDECPNNRRCSITRTIIVRLTANRVRLGKDFIKDLWSVLPRILPRIYGQEWREAVAGGM